MAKRAGDVPVGDRVVFRDGRGSRRSGEVLSQDTETRVWVSEGGELSVHRLHPDRPVEGR